MGMRMGFTRLRPAQLDTVVGDPERVQEIVDEAGRNPTVDDADCDLDKAWDGIQFLLDEADVPVDLSLGGDFMIGTAGNYFGWTADSVERAAQHLRATPFEQLARHYDPPKMTDVYPSRPDNRLWEMEGEEGLDYLREYYEDLVRFFAAAAASGSAAIMDFSF